MSVLEITEQVLNYYECPTCGYHFYDVYDQKVNMRCDSCFQPLVEPKHSWELPDGGIDELCVWDGVFQYLDDKEYDYEG